MNESLDLQALRRLGTDPADILQRRLTGKHDGVRAHVVQHVCRGAVDDAQLGADVTPKTRRKSLCQLHDAQVCDDQGVHSDLLQKSKIIRQPLQLLLTRQRIAGHINLRVFFM